SRIAAKRALIDGEVAVVMPDGKTDFQALQNALGHGEAGKGQLVYFAFDLLHVDGAEATRMGTEDRKARLKHLLSTLEPTSIVRFADHVVGQGPMFFASARKLGLEGIISKRRSAPYRPGRTPDWLKIKAIQKQELVICGFVDREGTTDQVGSLMLGVR